MTQSDAPSLLQATVFDKGAKKRSATRAFLDHFVLPIKQVIIYTLLATTGHQLVLH